MSSKEQEEIKPLRPYLEATIYEVLQQGLKELDKTRPDNPLEFLGKYLMSHAERTSNSKWKIYIFINVLIIIELLS